jgi:hypothetical protein
VCNPRPHSLLAWAQVHRCLSVAEQAKALQKQLLMQRQRHHLLPQGSITAKRRLRSGPHFLQPSLRSLPNGIAQLVPALPSSCLRGQA